MVLNRLVETHVQWLQLTRHATWNDDQNGGFFMQLLLDPLGQLPQKSIEDEH